MKWEIFCRVIDNYGDIGVCWRLARALASECGVDLRLWVDDWGTLAKLCPQAVQDGIKVDGVELRRWTEPFPAEEPADVVIEAFACELPRQHVLAMAARHQPPVWINLEYLSAEDWVRGCHGLSSPHPELPLKKTFFFPGVMEGTGGLIREEGLFDRCARALETRRRADWLEAYGIAPPREDALLVSLFCYRQPVLENLLQVWQDGARPVLLLIPRGRALKQAAESLGEGLIENGEARRGALRAAAFPFLSQDGYDELLWRCDFNLVRGEDSFVRAQWAAHPFVWHIYPQEGDAHLVKLEAFLVRYCAGLEEGAAKALAAFWRAWNGRGDPRRAWPALARVLPELEAHAGRWRNVLTARASLVAELWKFCRHILEESR